MTLRRSSGDRHRFLSAWAQRLREHVAEGLITGKTKKAAALKRAFLLAKGEILKRIEAINGPRVAGLRIGVGKDADRIISFLEKHDYAMLRWSIPSEKEHPDTINLKVSPITDWYGSKYVVYVPWSERLAEKDVQTHTLLREKLWERMRGRGDFWIAGLEESYQPVTLSIDFRRGSSHYFFLGETRSGKSWAMMNAVAQLAICPKNRFVFIEPSGKFGEGFGIMPEIRQAIGPPAYTVDEAKAALVWLRDEMESRYRNPQDNRIIVVLDELPALSGDSICTGIVDSLVRAGAGCNMHVFAAAQHATQEVLGKYAGILKANVSGRLIFHTSSIAGSVEGMYKRKAVSLHGVGDCYAFNLSMPPTRLQASYFPQNVLKARWEFGPPEMDSWPDVQKADLPDGNGVCDFTEYQIAEAVRIRLEGRIARKKGCSNRGFGRTTIQARLGINQNSSVRIVRIADQILDTIWTAKV